MEKDPKRRRVRITGRVQGVFFRDTTRRKARAMDLTGWVRNRADGSVEIVAEGPEEALDSLVEFCQEGPPRARVDRVRVEEEPATGEFGRFRVRH